MLLRRFMGKFVGKAGELERMVRRMVLESLGVGNYFDCQTESAKYKVRFSEYAPPPPGADELGEAAKQLVLGSHVDGNVSTLIWQNGVDGLEVQARGGDWIPVAPSSPSAVVFLIGDAFRAWSNDRLFAPPHRVRVVGGETRYSLMLFTIPKDEVVIEAPPELVDEGRPPRFRPYRYAEYMELLSSAIRKTTAGGGGGDDLTSLLTAFCAATGGGAEQQLVRA